MPTYTRKDADGNAVEKISPELGSPEDMRLAAACRSDEPVWAVEDEPEVEELRSVTSPSPVATVERPDELQGRAPKSPAAKKAETSGEGSNG